MNSELEVADQVEIRQKAAGLIKSLIYARLQHDPTFSFASEDRERWKIEKSVSDHRSLARLLVEVKILLEKFDERYFGTECNSISGPNCAEDQARIESLVTNVSSFFRETLDDAISLARRGEPIDWENIADWEMLPRIRDELDALAERPSRKKRTRGQSQQRDW